MSWRFILIALTIVGAYCTLMIHTRLIPLTRTYSEKRKNDVSLPLSPSSLPQPAKLTVHIYGGSVSNARSLGTGYTKHRFSNVLAQKLPSLEVINHGIGGSGPEIWNLCGIEPAGIIVSEFRLNELNLDILSEWYRLTHRMAQHTVILDLWSWLIPPKKSTTATVKGLLDIQESLNDANVSFSILSLEKRDLTTWIDMVGPFFNDTPIPQTCFDNKRNINIMKNCRSKYSYGMQHGGRVYHEYVGEQLAQHITRVVLPRLDLHGSKTSTPGSRTSLCITEYGLAAIFGRLPRWNNSIQERNFFKISNPNSDRKDKVTLNSNVTGANLTLTCPPPYDQSIKVGYVAHSYIEETAVMMLNGKRICTCLKQTTGDKDNCEIQDKAHKNPPIRVRTYSDTTVPAHITLQESKPGAFLEITDIICSSKPAPR